MNRISPTTTTGMPNLSLNSPPPVTFSGVAYDAYEALINPPGTSKSNGTMSVGMNGATNGLNKGSSYGQMDGADILNVAATDDILALLSNANFEAPFDFGMMYTTDGNAGPNGSSMPGDGGSGINAMNGMFGSPRSINFGVNGGSGPGAGSGTGGPYDSRDQNGQNFKMGTV